MQHRRTSEPRYRKSSLNPRGSAGSFISHFVLSKRGGVRGDSATFCVPMTTGGPSALSFAGKNFPDRINARETQFPSRTRDLRCSYVCRIDARRIKIIPARVFYRRPPSQHGMSTAAWSSMKNAGGIRAEQETTYAAVTWPEPSNGIPRYVSERRVSR